ncbi:hypothetical protein LW139_07655 [Proteus vulgaris]|uniref:hypothetical protein n=1 Tax=Proteus vulgaris TaxID=585 RepID=UPI001FFF98B5|nr:hypothetical protein [Proteus vulgaris]UPK82554.1 hypothetical protein LW139_07655 [Proteus vulgaris]
MKERGIIFNAEMVRAILDGRKTQTRRIIKSVPATHNFHGWVMSSTRAKDEGKACWAIGDSPLLKEPIRLNCPLGKVGDRLWVRETFGNRVVRDALGGYGEFITYRASKPDAVYCTCASGDVIPMKWTPSIHMPRRYSRITLEITDVRVEQLQDISKQDAISEGAPQGHYSIDVISKQFGFPDFSRSWFAQIWMDIYGEDSWVNNEWVWVIEFKRI